MALLSDEEAFLRACSRKGLLIDTNLLILLLIGRHNINEISSCSRTRNYTSKDYLFIETVLASTKARIILTPHSLAEIANLTFDKLFYGENLRQYFVHVVAALTEADERFIEKEILLAEDNLLKFGFTDMANALVARDGCAVLTEDGELYGYMAGSGYPVMNLNMIRAISSR